jgi:hypothetical protein
VPRLDSVKINGGQGRTLTEVNFVMELIISATE